jgi:hypothetical protein
MQEVLAHPLPLIRGGGLFVICVGLGFLPGWIVPRVWLPCAIAGFVTGMVASAMSPALQPPLGDPSRLQVAALITAIVVEIVLTWYVVARFGGGNERTFILSILLVVGFHFIIVGPAHGLLMALLGLLTMLNAVIGMYSATSVPLQAFGIIDSMLKIGFGVWMLAFYPAVTLW